MEHWHGIKLKPYNQSKHSGSKQSTPRSKTVIKSGNKVSPDKSIEDEVARAVQQIIALNKSEQSSYDKNMPNMSSVNDIGCELLKSFHDLVPSNKLVKGCKVFCCALIG